MANKYGEALWTPHETAKLAREIAQAEARPITTVLTRALAAYAAQSPEYQQRALPKPTPPKRPA